MSDANHAAARHADDHQTAVAPAIDLVPLGLMARLLHVPTSWLRDECAAGRIPHLRAGKAILFDYQLVRQLLLERARQTPAREEGAVATAEDPNDDE
jgi:hypothetical protein